MNEILLIGGMALVTFLIRYIMFPLSGQMEFPNCLARALRYVPPAVLTAIIAPAVLAPSGDGVRLGLENAHLMGALAACLVGGFTRSLLLTIVSGMIVFLSWRWLLTGVLT